MKTPESSGLLKWMGQLTALRRAVRRDSMAAMQKIPKLKTSTGRSAGPSCSQYDHDKERMSHWACCGSELRSSKSLSAARRYIRIFFLDLAIRVPFRPLTRCMDFTSFVTFLRDYFVALRKLPLKDHLP